MDTVDGYHMDYLSTYVVIRPTTYVMQVCCQGVLLKRPIWSLYGTHLLSVWTPDGYTILIQHVVSDVGCFFTSKKLLRDDVKLKRLSDVGACIACITWIRGTV